MTVELFLRFAYSYLLYFLIPAIVLVVLARLYWRKSSVYRYSLVSFFKSRNLTSRHPFRLLFFLSRLIALCALALLIAKPQLVDSRSTIKVDGIDMIMALDVSGSMQFNDFGAEKRRRIDVAKEEALRFITKRENDPIGLVWFGKVAVSRCPLTLDKKMLSALVNQVDIGVIDPDGTVLAMALLTAANRLKNSKSATKIIILLTDGEPSQGDISPQVALDVVKKLGIKVYTIGIGSDEDQYVMHPLYGVVAMPKVNKTLLNKIAQETGGQSFLAKNPQDMRAIYDTIDTLEKTTYETNIYSTYYDVFMPFVWILFFLIIVEQLLATFWWFSVSI